MSVLFLFLFNLDVRLSIVLYTKPLQSPNSNRKKKVCQNLSHHRSPTRERLSKFEPSPTSDRQRKSVKT